MDSGSLELGGLVFHLFSDVYKMAIAQGKMTENEGTLILFSQTLKVEESKVPLLLLYF